MKTIGIVGTRRRNTFADLDKVIKKFKQVYEEGDVICSGGCPKGGDRFAEILAKRMGLTIIIHYPNWSKYGRTAGFVRNGMIAAESDVLIACVASDRKGGTEDTIKKYHKYGKRDLHLV